MQLVWEGRREDVDVFHFRPVLEGGSSSSTAAANGAAVWRWSAGQGRPQITWKCLCNFKVLRPAAQNFSCSYYHNGCGNGGRLRVRIRLDVGHGKWRRRTGRREPKPSILPRQKQTCLDSSEHNLIPHYFADIKRHEMSSRLTKRRVTTPALWRPGTVGYNYCSERDANGSFLPSWSRRAN